jgi:hypothetical protein
MYKGAVAWRKIALAAVVYVFASVNNVNVAAYGIATTREHHVHPRRATGRKMSIAIAAVRLRKHESCQPVSVADLMATPPVENSSAPTMI